MSLGDYEHTYYITIEVTVRSKSSMADRSMMSSVANYFGMDGVEISTIRVSYQGCRDLLQEHGVPRREEDSDG